MEVAGPERFRLDDLVGRVLRANNDTREVITDAHTRYFGAELDDETLVPGQASRIGSKRFDTWLEG